VGLEEQFEMTGFWRSFLDLTVAVGEPPFGLRPRLSDPPISNSRRQTVSGLPMRRWRIGGHGVMEAPMAVFLSKFLLPVAIGAVALVLLLGLVNLMRGGSPNRSQQLMRLRVLLQFVAIVVIMLTIWVMGR
jgi:Hypoxia induced protein conserved region